MTESVKAGRIPIAIYGEFGLEEYKSNPLIAALPPVYEAKQVVALLRDNPAFNRDEINLSGNIRVHAIARLLKSFFQPLNHHIQLEQKISLIIRQGYIGRNPETGEHYSHLQNGYERIMTGDLDARLYDDVSSSASSLSLFGCSGCGKSRTLDRIMRSYPQALLHPETNITQLVYLKLDCPIDGDLDELCLSFFNQVDKVLLTRYSQSHGRKKLGTKRLLANMCQIANLHALGVLIIDEVQNLNEARSGGAEKMHNFFVSLVNTIGVPVIQVGTHRARKFFERTLRAARRITGLGSLLWDRLPQDKHWDGLLKHLWQFQWLKKAEPLNQELIDTMYELTQGVMDFVVKLFVLAQARAIVTNAERITPKLLRQVFKDEFKPVHPMLEALKSGREDLIREYDDLLMPEIEARLISTMAAIDNNCTVETPITPSDDKAKRLLSLLAQMEIPQDIAIPFVDEVLTKHSELPIPALINKLTSYTAAPKEQETVKFRKVKRSQWSQLPSDDLRYQYAMNNSDELYGVFKNKGLVFDLQAFVEKAG